MYPGWTGEQVKRALELQEETNALLREVRDGQAKLVQFYEVTMQDGEDDKPEAAIQEVQEQTSKGRRGRR